MKTDAFGGEIRSLTGLRGVAALLTATYHFEWTTSPLWGGLFNRGYLWVDLFFVLSGFVISMSYARMFSVGWTLVTFRQFLLRRLARVYPLYLALTILGIALYLFLKRGYDGVLPDNVWYYIDSIANLTLISAWHISISADPPAWSVSAEAAAYLAFPLLLRFVRKPWNRWLIMLVAVACLLTTIRCAAADGVVHAGTLDAYDGRTLEPLLRCFAGFLVGMVAYQWLQNASVGRMFQSGRLSLLLCAMLGLGLLCDVPDLVLYPLFPLIVVSLAASRGIMSRCFGSRPIHFLGLISYSIYLIHMFLVPISSRLLAYCNHFEGAVWVDPLAIALTYVTLISLSALTYYFVEIPGRTALRRIAASGAA